MRRATRKSGDRTAGSLSVRSTLGVPKRSKSSRSRRRRVTVLRLSTGHSSRQAREPWSSTPRTGLESPPAPLHPGPVECPDHVAAKRSRRPLLDLSSHAENLFAVIAEHAGHEGLADGHGPLVLVLVEAVEGVGDPTASRLGHQCPESEHLATHPRRLRWLEPVKGSRGRLGGRRTRLRTPPRPVGPLCHDERQSEAQQQQDEDGEDQGHSGVFRVGLSIRRFGTVAVGRATIARDRRIRP